MVEGGMKCIKLLLFVFNLLFVIAGIGLIGAGSYVQIKLTEYSDILGSQYTGPGILIIIVGVVIFGIAFFGCCGAIKENYCLVMTFGALLTIIFILEIAGGIAGFVLKNQIESDVITLLKEKEGQYYKNDGVKASFDALQKDFACCGVDGPNDWINGTANNTIPTSCCKDFKQGQTCDLAKAYPEGCEKKFVDYLKNNIGIIGGIGIGLAFIQVVGICFACCLARAIRKEYEVV
ncbi:hypothetical protein LOTGIDRAFT_204983 [Lottia gigantea]|uniref:Tetraspanin n=1 Tax=Lottia gigantea TaxID=225164 RepID=V4BEN5_LOTGI|nr:hypothetical protein LOTGIDRAFT_204983 [Lottia gigantea]ESP04272.1 hypothetical protein LOTGIDRAFT_204983 [Lottia gigantea]